MKPRAATPLRAVWSLLHAAQLLLFGSALAGTAAQAEPPLRLRYGWAAHQTWQATHSMVRETQLRGSQQTERGIARFEYRVLPAEPEGALRIEARLLSQETKDGISPLDFSAIEFSAQIDALGRLRGAHYVIAEAQPPQLEGVDAPDPIAYRQMLRQVASAWRGAVFWFPELPERQLLPGDTFAVDEARNLTETQPGVTLRMRSARTYRLLAVEAGIAKFHVEEISNVDAETAESGIASEQRAEGEALFDLGLGMWTRQELVSKQRASYTGAAGAAPDHGEASAATSTTLEMQRVTPAEAR